MEMKKITIELKAKNKVIKEMETVIIDTCTKKQAIQELRNQGYAVSKKVDETISRALYYEEEKETTLFELMQVF